MWFNTHMTTHGTKRPYCLIVMSDDGFSLWSGRRTRSFATVAAARAAAINLAATILEISPAAVRVDIREGVYGPTVERIEIEAQ
jgi:predicted secreted protein